MPLILHTNPYYYNIICILYKYHSYILITYSMYKCIANTPHYSINLVQSVPSPVPRDHYLKFLKTFENLLVLTNLTGQVKIR